MLWKTLALSLNDCVFEPLQVDWLTEKMRQSNFTVASMHGDMVQKEREAIMGEFRCERALLCPLGSGGQPALTTALPTLTVSRTQTPSIGPPRLSCHPMSSHPSSFQGGGSTCADHDRRVGPRP